MADSCVLTPAVGKISVFNIQDILDQFTSISQDIPDDIRNEKDGTMAAAKLWFNKSSTKGTSSRIFIGMASTSGLTGIFESLRAFENGMEVYKSFKEKLPEMNIPDSMKYEANAIHTVITLYNCLQGNKSFGVKWLIAMFPQIVWVRFVSWISSPTNSALFTVRELY